MATLAYKYTLAARFLLAELDVGVAPSRATPFYFGAQAALDGTTCERLAKKSRWMAMRYAMLSLGYDARHHRTPQAPLVPEPIRRPRQMSRPRELPQRPRSPPRPAPRRGYRSARRPSRHVLPCLCTDLQLYTPQSTAHVPLG
jgi:hypothetical protein